MCSQVSDPDRVEGTLVVIIADYTFQDFHTTVSVLFSLFFFFRSSFVTFCFVWEIEAVVIAL